MMVWLEAPTLRMLESDSIRNSLNDLGFLIAEEKCDWEPKRQVVWLGLDWDFEQGVMHITERRIRNLKDSINQLLCVIHKPFTLLRVRLLANILGQIASMHTVFGSLVQLKARETFKCVNSRASWNSRVLLSPESKSELIFWKDNVDGLNVLGLSKNTLVQSSVYTDASGIGYGGYVLEQDGLEMVGSWSENEMCKSSTWRELEAVYRMASDMVQGLEGLNVRLYTDNKNVVKIIKSGSNNPELQQKSLQIREICVRSDMKVDPVWIPRKENKRADDLSRMADSDDWQINTETFAKFDSKWGPHSFDRFACGYNTKCQKFNSRGWYPGTSGVDAFSQKWAGETNWWVPPPKLIPRTVVKLVAEKACGTLVVPYWQSAPFWPKVWNGLTFNSFVQAHELLPANVVIKGKGKNGIFGKRGSSFKLIALKICF